jgi:peroxiredoxin (alkyl hydroperoxide reductase subunit C)
MDEGIQVQAPTALPRIGDPAPQFTADTTFGTLALEDFRGSWLILFSHPADFTPVCTTEFIAFAEIHPQLRELNCELMGLSVDSVYSHIAWVRNVKEKMGVEITFPVIADLNKEVATLYGMINPGESKTETSRAVFIIDDKQVVRAIIYYPLTTGRNMDEIIRVVKALQTSDEHNVATPANWEPGQKVIMPPPKSVEDADQRVGEEGMECADWYFCKKDL